MNIPTLVLLGFATWTLLVLCGTVGVYRWTRILTGRSSIAEWRSDLSQGSDWYQRATRAHMNCIENLPIYTALVVASIAANVRSSSLDAFAVVMLIARVGQTLVHIAMPPTNFYASLRFAFFFLQVICMVAMGIVIATKLLL
jgi:uncharacterized MAPEG superfamily protein